MPVLFGTDNGRLALVRTAEKRRILDPTLKLLVPRIGPNVVCEDTQSRRHRYTSVLRTNNTNDQFVLDAVDAHY